MNRRDRWAIQEIRVNVITDCNVRYPDKGVFDDLLARDAWDPLDSILAVLKLEKLVSRVQALESIYVWSLSGYSKSAFRCREHGKYFTGALCCVSGDTNSPI